MSKVNKKALWTRMIFVLAIIFLVNLIASYIYHRFDLTSEQRYSISDSSKKMLKNMKGKVFVKVYLEGELQSGFLRLRNATEDVLKELNSETDGKIQYEFVNPIKHATTEEEKLKIYQELAAKGLQGTNLKLQTEESYKEQIIFPCLEVNANGKIWPVQILESQTGFSAEEALNNSIISLEYKICNAIKKLSDKKEFKIGILQGHGEYHPGQMEAMITELQNYQYNIGVFDISSKVKSSQGDSLGTWFPPNLDLVIIANPTISFSEVEKYRLDQFVMNGGKILWAVEGMDAKLDYLRTSENMFMSHGVDLNLEDLFFKYGVRINKNLIQDAQQSAPLPLIDKSNKETVLFPWLFHPLLTPTFDHSIGRNLNPVFGQFSSGIDTIQNGLKKTIILSTSQYGRALPDPVRVHLASIKDKPDFKYFKQRFIPAGILIEGKFESVYKNRLENEFIQNLKAVGQSPKTISVDNKMIVLSDADILRNDFTPKGEVFPMGYEMYSRQIFGNKDFVLNCIEYLIDPNNLLDSRNKEIKVRLLDAKKIKVEATRWQFLNLLLPLSLIIVFGLSYTYWRKRKWTNLGQMKL